MDQKSGHEDTQSGYSHRVITSLNREQVDFLDKIGKDAQFSAGVKLSRTQIIAAMVNVMKHLELSGNGVKSAEEFEKQILLTLSAFDWKRLSSERPNGGHGSGQLGGGDADG